MHKTINKIVNKRKSEAGFSLMELIIAGLLFIIISGAIFGLLALARADRNRASRRSDTSKNARAAMHLIGRDALNAGLSFHKDGGFAKDDFLLTRLGLPQDNDTKRDRLTAVIAGNDVFPNDLQDERTDSIAFIYRDMDFNRAQTIQLKEVNPTGSTTPRVTVTKTGAAEEVKPYDLFLIETGDSMQVPVMVTAVPTTSTVDFAPGDPLGVNQSLTATGPNGSLLRICSTSITSECLTNKLLVGTMKKFFWVSYRITEDGTLMRTEFGNNTGGGANGQIREQPLAYGIQDMQIKYVLEDGTFSADPTVGPDKIKGNADDEPGKMNLVRQITVTLRVQSSELDERGVPEVVTVTSNYAVRNIAYDAG